MSSMMMKFLAGGTLLMFAVMLVIRSKERWPLWKTALLSLITLVAGVSGAKLMNFIENGSWGGYSFFGSLFLVPLVMLAAAPIFRRPAGELCDLSAPAVAVMVALMKVQCLIDGCCYGIALAWHGDVPVRFPSQIVECVNGLVLMTLLLVLYRKGRFHHYLYPVLMVTYGVTRFFLEMLRMHSLNGIRLFISDRLQPAFIPGLHPGQFWSAISIAIGLTLLLRARGRYRGLGKAQTKQT